MVIGPGEGRGMSAYADMAFGAFVTGAVILCARAIERRDDRVAMLGGLFLGGALMTKQEGLVWLGDKALTDYLHRRYPRRHQTRARSNHLAKPFTDGDAAGQAIELRHPLKPGSAGDPKRLTSGT